MFECGGICVSLRHITGPVPSTEEREEGEVLTDQRGGRALEEVSLIGLMLGAQGPARGFQASAQVVVVVPLQGDGVHASWGVPAGALGPEGLHQGDGAAGGGGGGRQAVSQALAPRQDGQVPRLVQLREGKVVFVVCQLGEAESQGRAQHSNSTLHLNKYIPTDKVG